MSRFRTRKFEESGGHRHGLGLGGGALEEGRHRLGRHLVPDGGIGSSAVVVGLDELDHGVPGGIPGGKRLSVVHLVLQRDEERLGDRVVVAVAGAAAGQAHVVVARPLGQQPAGVLGHIGRKVCKESSQSSANKTRRDGTQTTPIPRPI